MRKFSVCFSIMFFYCVSDTALDPESVSLISPKNLESCTNAVRINDTDRQVSFEWTDALNVDQYELIVENSITKEKFISNTPLLNSSLVISAGAPYRWFVRSKSDFTSVTKNSEIWQFYLERIPTESHIPFPASLLSPLNNTSVSLNNENQILFRWKGADLDNDIESYHFYIGVQEENLNLEKEDISTSQVSIELDSNSTYFWQIKTTDKSNNSSYSEIFSFETQ